MDPIAHVPLAAGPAFIERIQRLPSKFGATLRREADNRFDPAAVAVFANGEKIGYLPPEISRHYFGVLKGEGAECQGRRAPQSAHENTGVDVLLDLSGVPCEP
jgi:HIRAN domain-containing protein